MTDDTYEFTNPVYYSDDADVSTIEDEVVAVLGYGSQGHAQAQNLADSGIDVVVGLREGSSSRQAAEDDGLRVETPAAAAAMALVAASAPHAPGRPPALTSWTNWSRSFARPARRWSEWKRD